MSQTATFRIKELNSMKKYPENIFFKGNLELLKKRKIAIVGSRHPNAYAKKITHKIANELAKREIVIVSGAAIGTDSIAHKAATPKNTIAVMANGLDIKYPAINAKLIESIEKEGLTLSSYKDGQKPRNYTFVQRNEIVVSLAQTLIVTYADEKSGTLTSIDYALKMGKKVYTIPHHLDDSLGTQKLLEEGKIHLIYNLEKFLNSFGEIKTKNDDLSNYLKTFPSYEEAVRKYKNRIFQLELEGEIKIENGYIKPV
ncbi:DNA-processing protein DprA [Halarcobacter anaerophilus]|jgi:DNA processing protein|uniref:DNA processing protein DprA n=1 Tax=Halarcobacter anaerophilus TaxID=877500 RepID=A0A4Q0XZK2_9BACT|nr:DNA-processing protein DprA [Halarcobacter anaerophilus]QDF30096.1 DNA protecting protein DprA [Halarcobacter anaerophilus]RXJ63140.1 DNA processing protein DprA [Halarcobacter anaerophilus]